MVDGSGEQPLYEFDAVRLELELFSPELAEKPYLVAFNKMDLPEAYEKWDSFKQSLEDRGINPFCISAANRQGTQDAVSSMYQLLQSEWNAEKEAQGRLLHLNQHGKRPFLFRDSSCDDCESVNGFHDFPVDFSVMNAHLCHLQIGRLL